MKTMASSLSSILPSLLLSFFFLSSTASSLREDGRPVVGVDQGSIVGVQENYTEVTMFAFRGIPYAQPPLDELRFMPPVASGPWEGELDASAEAKVCTQFIRTGVEDCLFLNVYTPIDALSNTSSPKAVMVYIHGGGFYLGSARKFDNPYALIQNDVIVVLIQYRLGIIGFFSTGDDAAPGNQGLQDQTLALKWVKDNIDSFGGDPSRITLFGQSAGAASTHYQILTPDAAGLFQNAILMSGDAFCPWSAGRQFYNTSRTLAQRFNCPLEPSEDLVTCLQGVNHYLLDDMYASFIDWNAQPFYFAPRVDGTYIPDDPATLVIEGRFNRVPTIMGVLRNEAALESGELYTKPFLIESLTNNFTENGPVSLELHDDEDPVNTSTLVYDYYLGGIDINEENGDNVTKMFTDRLFTVNVDWLVQEQASQADVYFYEFDYRGQWGLMDVYQSKGMNVSGSEDWIAHSDDLQYLFELNSPGPLNTTDDINMSVLYSTLFSNFAKFGTPTPDDTLLGFVWPLANASTLEHLSINIPTSTMAPDSRSDVRGFWEGLPLRINAILH